MSNRCRIRVALLDPGHCVGATFGTLHPRKFDENRRVSGDYKLHFKDGTVEQASFDATSCPGPRMWGWRSIISPQEPQDPSRTDNSSGTCSTVTLLITMTTTKLISSSENLVSTTALDDVGWVAETEPLSDLPGVDCSDQDFDVIGRRRILDHMCEPVRLRSDFRQLPGVEAIASSGFLERAMGIESTTEAWEALDKTLKAIDLAALSFPSDDLKRKPGGN